MRATPTAPRRRLLDVPALAMLATATVFAIVALALTLRLREELRDQILRREARSIHSMIELQEKRSESFYREFGLGAEPEDWFPLLLETSRLRGVVALWLFDASGALRESLPVTATAALLTPDAERLRSGESFARLHDNVTGDALRTGAIAPAAEQARTQGVTLLEVLVPLRDPVRGGFGGSAQYWIDGTSTEREFRLLDRHLWLYSGFAATIVFLALAWSFGKLRKALDELRLRTEDLEKANRELGLAAKMSALGAITAHLIHGLKNPLAGIEGYVSSQPSDDPGGAGEAWHTAMDTTRRLRTLVNDVVSILREEERGGAKYRMSFSELLAVVDAKVRPAMEERDVSLVLHCEKDAELQGRCGHLAALVLENLLRNACEAVRPGGHVSLSLRREGAMAMCVVEDDGPGLPESVQAHLFQPVASTKPGGGGIGLVLSRQLAQHAGGSLSLEKSGPDGCRFVLSIPCESQPA